MTYCTLGRMLISVSVKAFNIVSCVYMGITLEYLHEFSCVSGDLVS